MLFVFFYFLLFNAPLKSYHVIHLSSKVILLSIIACPNIGSFHTPSNILIVLSIQISSIFFRSLHNFECNEFRPCKFVTSTPFCHCPIRPSTLRNRFGGGSIVNRRVNTHTFSMQVTPSQHTIILSSHLSPSNALQSSSGFRASPGF